MSLQPHSIVVELIADAQNSNSFSPKSSYIAQNSNSFSPKSSIRNRYTTQVFVLLLLILTHWTHLSAQTAFPVASAEESGFSAQRLDRLTSVMQNYADSGRLSGGVVLVLRDGKSVVFEAFGKRDVESNTEMTKDAMFRIASQTKAIVSVAVMMLQEEGSLLIGEPVGNYLPEFLTTTVAVANDAGSYDIVPARRAITIRDLLTHTAGINYGYGLAGDRWSSAGLQGWYFAHRDEPVRETVRRMASLPFAAQPGEQFVYGYSTDILGVLVEVVSGMSLDDFLKTRIFEPLGMSDTHFYVPPSKANRLATVYAATSDKGIERAADAPQAAGIQHYGQGHYLEGPRVSFSGGAGLVSTATDYARFLQMLLNGGQLDGIRLLSPKTVELLTINHIPHITFVPGMGISLAFDVVTDTGARGVPGSEGDFGWGGAYHSTYWVSPKDRLVVVFFTQLIPATGSDIHGKLRTLLYQALID
jgi:CubicO group peptidase (beta-lactamase class C family)